MNKTKGPIGFYFDRYSNEQMCTQLELGGHATKEFVRFFDQDYLKQFFRAVRKKGNSYKSIYNDVILSGYNPKYISVMKKTIDDDTGYYNQNAMYDVAGSRIANLLGVPTAYNFIFTERNIDEDGYEDTLNTEMLSVDFADYGKNMIDLSEAIYRLSDDDLKRFDIHINKDSLFTDLLLEDWFKIFNNLPDMNSPIPKSLLTSENMEKVKKEFIKMYFFRSYIIDDEDLEPRNVALRFNKEQGLLELAPSHDYDFSFKPLSHILYKLSASNDINYCLKHYPDVVEDIMKGYANLRKKYGVYLDDKNELIGEEYCDLYKSLKDELQDSSTAEHVTSSVIRNFKRLTDIYKECKNEFKKTNSVSVM